MVEARTQTGGYRESNRATAGLVAWTIAWAGTLAVARFGPVSLWGSEQQVMSWLAVGANIVVGIGWIVAFTRFLQAVDELQRKIVQDALAVTLGVGVVGGFAYVVADAAGLMAADISIGVFPVALGIVYMVAIAVGHVRYR